MKVPRLLLDSSRRLPSERLEHVTCGRPVAALRVRRIPFERLLEQRVCRAREEPFLQDAIVIAPPPDPLRAPEGEPRRLLRDDSRQVARALRFTETNVDATMSPTPGAVARSLIIGSRIAISESVCSTFSSSRSIPTSTAISGAMSVRVASSRELSASLLTKFGVEHVGRSTPAARPRPRIVVMYCARVSTSAPRTLSCALSARRAGDRTCASGIRPSSTARAATSASMASFFRL